jgi:hypothetical protein
VEGRLRTQARAAQGREMWPLCTCVREGDVAALHLHEREAESRAQVACVGMEVVHWCLH